MSEAARQSVTIVDLGYGNLRSIQVAFERLGAEPRLASDPGELRAADRLVLPGVGAAGFAMERLRGRGLDDLLRGFSRPVLGICLGMQLLFERSEEGGTEGLGLIEGEVRRLEPGPGRPVPHMGWSRLSVSGNGRGLNHGDYVWFAHSFACAPGRFGFAELTYGQPIAAAVARENLLGCQFHPERSGEAGARFLRAFVDL